MALHPVSSVYTWKKDSDYITLHFVATRITQIKTIELCATRLGFL